MRARAARGSGYETPSMKPRRILVLLHVLGTLVFRRPIGIAMGVNAPILPFFLLTLPVPLILVALVWIPSWEGRRGRWRWLARALLRQPRLPVLWQKVRRLHVETSPRMRVYADAAEAGETPVEIEAVSGGLQVVR